MDTTKVVECVPYPAVVDDLISDQEYVFDRKSLRFDAACDHVIVAGAAVGPAYIFRVESGNARDAIPIEVPRSRDDDRDIAPAAPSVAIWRVQSGGTGNPGAKAVGVAAVSRDGALRVYDRISLNGSSQDLPSMASCRELRLASALAASAGLGRDVDVRCWADQVVYVEGDKSHPPFLTVFGSCGSAVSVQLDLEVLVAKPLSRKPRDALSTTDRHTHTPSRTFGIGSKLFSAFRSIGLNDTTRDHDWAEGSGQFEIVGKGVGRQGSSHSFVMRYCGEVEKWGSECLLWKINVTDIVKAHCPTGSVNFAVLEGTVSSEETVVVLAGYSADDEQRCCLLCIDASSNEVSPSTSSLFVDLGLRPQEDNGAWMTVSRDIAYICMCSIGLVQWTSVARGLPLESQVRGEHKFTKSLVVLGCVDLLRDDCIDGLPVAGRIAFLGREEVTLLSSQAPAPVSALSLDRADAPRQVDLDTTRAEYVPLFWRAFLQYSEGQVGASQATVQVLLQSTLVSEERRESNELDNAVFGASSRITDTFRSEDGDITPLLLLLDSQLRARVEKQTLLLRMLADTYMLRSSPILERSDGDRLWDFLGNRVRAVLVANLEKLTAALRLREMQNLGIGAVRKPGSFTESVIASERSEPRSATFEKALSVSAGTFDEHDEHDGLTLVADALQVAAYNAAKSLRVSLDSVSAEDLGVVLYGLASHFELILPALRVCVGNSLHFELEKFSEGDDSVTRQHGQVRRRICRNLLLANNAAVAVVKAAANVREECQASFSIPLVTLEPNGGWSCDDTGSRSVLRDLIQWSLDAAKLCRASDAKSLHESVFSLADTLLECARTAHVEQGLRDAADGTVRSPRKRQRLSKMDESATAWGGERRLILNYLRDNDLRNDAFALSRKFEDFGFMLELKVSKPDFDEMMEAAVAEFGSEFAFYAFQWMEDRGELKSLVYGCSGEEDASNSGWSVSVYPGHRSKRLEKLLDQYLDRKTMNAPNISWMVHLAHGTYDAAADCLDQQSNALLVPGKPRSLTNARTLLSIAKLCLLAGSQSSTDTQQNTAAQVERQSNRNEGPNHSEMAKVRSNVERCLYLTRAQYRLEPGNESLLPHDELVRRYVDEMPVETGRLAEGVVVALEVLRKSAVSGDDESELNKYIWRRCIEKQGHFWLPILVGKLGGTDTELRSHLASTALFAVAKRIQADVDLANDIMNSGIAESAEFAAVARPEMLKQLIHTTIVLATEGVDSS